MAQPQATSQPPSGPYRIAMVGACPFPTSQGSQVLIRQLSEALLGRGHAVHVVTYHFGESSLRLPPGLQLHRILPVPGYRKIGSGPAWGKVLLDLLLLWLLLWVVLRQKIEIIHAHNYEALLVGWLVGWLTGRPVVYHSHNIMAAELPAYFRRRWAKRLAGYLAYLLDRHLPRRADACVALSSEAVTFFRDCGVPEGRIRLIPPGIAFDPQPAVTSAQVVKQTDLEAGPMVIYTGNLDQYQRLETLLCAFQSVRQVVPAAQLVIASHSPAAQYESLLRWTGDCGGLRFIHTPSFAHMQALLLAADVAVCPRVACFGFPIKLLNYMAAGKAIVVAQGSAKGIRHLDNGYIVPDDEAGLAAGIIHLLQNPALTRQLGAAARVTVEGRFQWRHVVREVVRCYDDLTNSQRDRRMVEGRLVN